MRSEPDPETAAWVRVRAEPLPSRRRAELVAIAKALGDAHRLEILHLLAVAEGAVCVLDFEHHLGLAQSTVSHHLKVLVDAGICTREARGRWAYYRVQRAVLAAFRHDLEHLITVAEPFPRD